MSDIVEELRARAKRLEAWAHLWGRSAEDTPGLAGAMAFDNEAADEVVRLRTELAAAAERERVLRKALEEARDSIASWGDYAPEYFREKHNLQDDIDRCDAALRLCDERTQRREDLSEQKEEDPPRTDAGDE